VKKIEESNSYLCHSTIEIQNFLRLRNIVLEHIRLNPRADLPKYLLAFEINSLLKYAYNLSHSMLIKTIWLTGGLISEVLSLKVSDFIIFDDYLTVSLITRKQDKKGAKKVTPLLRVITITDDKYIKSLKLYITVNKLEKTNFLFKITDRTARNWINKAVDEAKKNRVVFPFKINPQILRHSNAMHLVFNNYSAKEIQTLLGHTNIQNTHIYTNLKNLDIKQRTKFL